MPSPFWRGLTSLDGVVYAVNIFFNLYGVKIVMFIEQYAACGKLEGNAWETMGNHLCLMDYASAKAFLHMEEQRFKQEHGPLPNAYRSAKSVALSMLKNNRCLFDIDGSIKGKSACQAEIKACKEDVPKNLLDEAAKHLSAVRTIHRRLVDDMDDSEELRVMVASLASELGVL
jgi:hypothetical protein